MSNVTVRGAIRTALRAQQGAVHALGASVVASVERAVDSLSSVEGSLIVTGAGKSGHIARKIAATMVSVGVSASFLHPNDAMHGDIGMISKSDALLAISHSGSTDEIMRVVRHSIPLKIPIVAIVGRNISPLAELSSVVISYAVDDEGSPHNLAPMASTTVSLVLGDLLAAGLAAKRGFTASHFAATHPGGSLGLKLKTVGAIMRTGARIPKIKAGTTFAVAVRVINEVGTGVVAVLDDKERLLGVLTDGDIRRYIGNPDFSMNVSVRTIMTRGPVVISPAASLWDALNVMESKRITSLFVIEMKSVVGFVHMHDVLRYRDL